MKEVQNKWSTLKMNDDIWAKLIYFEQNRRLAKAYVSAPVLTVDGSTNGLDGFRIGLSGIDNDYRNLDSIACLRSIGQGVKLRIDNHGNILIRKIGRTKSVNQCSVFVKDWPALASPTATGTANSSSSARGGGPMKYDEGACMMHEIEQSDTSYKLFDMNKFRLQIERRKSNGENVLDWRQCVSIISFVRTIDGDRRNGAKDIILRDPCWLMIINIIAIDMLKSSICDNDQAMSSISKKPMSPQSTLVQDHRILSQRNSNTSEYSTPTGCNNFIMPRHREPLRASSSASILYQDPNLSNSNANTDQSDYMSSSTQRQHGNPLTDVTNDRIKKLRTNHHRYGRMSAMNDDLYYRRYKSTQQLANNTIYTTFNSKFINLNNKPKPLKQNSLVDNLSTSDYNSTSKNSSSSRFSYWTHYQNGKQQLPGNNYCPTVDSRPPRFLTNSGSIYGDPVDLDSRRNSSTTTSGSSLSSNKNKSLSLSTFELESNRRDIKFLHSSIKMNFDDDDEEQENDKKDRQEDIPEQSPEIINKRPHKLDNTRISGHISPDYCRAEQQVTTRISPNQKQQQKPDIDKQRQQKISRSSIASSSSSSGCVDNDYFMSNSSSSMSSSTRSNECEMFSQQASSSGIVCSGSTSDECDDGRKLSSASNQSAKDRIQSVPKSRKSPVSSPSSGEDHVNTKGVKSKRSSSNSRGNYKCAEQSPVDYCCEHEASDDLVDCGCLQPETYDCDCCCDCNVDVPLNTEPINTNNDYGYSGGEPIYGRLPYPTTISNPRPNGLSKKNYLGKAQKNELSSMTRISSLANIGEDFDKISSIPFDDDEPKLVNVGAKADRKNASWLERRKYINILPKFMFQGGNRSQSSNGRKSGSSRVDNAKKISGKSATLDQNGQFLRLTRSTQNLSIR